MLIAIAKAAKRFYAKCLRFRLFHVQLLLLHPLLPQPITVPIRLIFSWQQRKNLLLLVWAGPNYQDDQGVNKFIQSFIETNWLTDDDDDALQPKRWSSGSEKLDLVTWAVRGMSVPGFNLSIWLCQFAVCFLPPRRCVPPKTVSMALWAAYPGIQASRLHLRVGGLNNFIYSSPDAFPMHTRVIR